MLKVKYNSTIVPKGFISITIWPFGIYFKEKKDIYINKFGQKKHDKIIRHERIHEYQQKGLLGIFFYVLYLLNWVINWFIHGKKAYKNISFEREASENDDDLNYYKKCYKYKWLNYFFYKRIH